MPFQSDIPALYLPLPLESGTALTLPDEEARHVRALRLRTGDRVLLLDGMGRRVDGVIEALDRRGIVVRTSDVVFDEVETGPYIILSCGVLADKTRMEWCVEKAVELGVREILPLQTERTEGRLQRSRLERIAIAALKQSQRSWLPRIHEPRRIALLSEILGEFDRVFLCHERAPTDRPLMQSLGDRGVEGRVLVIIGPEGGLTDEEAQLGGDVEVVSLGDVRFRAETAAIVAVSLIAQFGASTSRD